MLHAAVLRLSTDFPFPYSQPGIRFDISDIVAYTKEELQEVIEEHAPTGIADFDEKQSKRNEQRRIGEARFCTLGTRQALINSPTWHPARGATRTRASRTKHLSG